jgi:hypothetical protein
VELARRIEDGELDFGPHNVELLLAVPANAAR